MSKHKYSEKDLAEAVKSSYSYSSVLKALGIPLAGGNHTHIKNRIAAASLDVSHFTGQAHLGSKAGPRKSLEEILVLLALGSPKPKTAQLRRALLESGIPLKCSECTIESIWNKKFLQLEVDHIDGNWLNNVLSNLRFLCPNCHSQQSTTNKPHKYRVGNRKNICSCGNKKSSSALTCQLCYNKNRNTYSKPKTKRKTKIVWPSDAELLERLSQTNYRKLSRELGVSDNAIRKHLKK